MKEIDLHRWFPPNDEVAAAVARLCILREDFYLEALGFGVDSISDLDANGIGWRRLYFLRQSFKTLLEAQSALMILKQNRAFQRALKNEDISFREAILDFEEKVERANLRDVRNAVSGHVLHSRVKKLLQRMDSTDTGLTIFGSIHSDTHYKFAANLVWGIVLNDVTKEQEKERLDEIMRAILSDLMGAVDRVMTAYAGSRRLL